MRSILAGCSISLAAMANICCQNKIIGSLFFIIGLFLVLTRKYSLFTGKICSVLEQRKSYWVELLLIYFGNLIGCLFCGFLFSKTSLHSYSEAYSVGLSNRIGANWLSIIILGLFCNCLIFVAVDGYNNGDKEWKKILSLFFGVSVFVVSGFEHCVADMFYITFCGMWSSSSLLFLINVTTGNIIGGILCNFLKKILNTPLKHLTNSSKSVILQEKNEAGGSKTSE